MSIAAGIHFDAAGQRTLGADVRLIVPGDRCLRCCGGLADYSRALRELATSHRVLAAQRAAASWRDERAGSLRSLNQIATGVGFRLLEDLFAGRVRESRWVRVEFDERGSISTREPSMGQRDPDCPLCAKMGEGDRAV